MFDEVAKPVRAEVDVEETSVNLLETDVMALQQPADRDAACVPTDSAVVGDQASLEVARVCDGRKLCGEGTR